MQHDMPCDQDIPTLSSMYLEHWCLHLFACCMENTTSSKPVAPTDTGEVVKNHIFILWKAVEVLPLFIQEVH